MTATRWRDSLPPPQPTRHRVRARQDFEDSTLADQLQGPANPARAMLAAAQAPRQRIVLPHFGQRKQALPFADVNDDRPETHMDDWGDLTADSLPSFLRYAGMVAAGTALVICTWLLSVHLPELLERLGT